MTNYQKIYGGFSVDVYCFDLFGKWTINFIKLDAIRPKTERHLDRVFFSLSMFKTISRLSVVFFSSHFWFVARSHQNIFYWVCSASVRRQCIFEQRYFNRIYVEIVCSTDWATCHLSISKQNDAKHFTCYVLEPLYACTRAFFKQMTHSMAFLYSVIGVTGCLARCFFFVFHLANNFFGDFLFFLLFLGFVFIYTPFNVFNLFGYEVFRSYLLIKQPLIMLAHTTHLND